MMTLKQLLVVVCGRIQIVDEKAKEPILFVGDLDTEDINKLTSKMLRKHVQRVGASCQGDGTLIIFVVD